MECRSLAHNTYVSEGDETRSKFSSQQRRTAQLQTLDTVTPYINIFCQCPTLHHFPSIGLQVFSKLNDLR
jgi:hypothetical protein